MIICSIINIIIQINMLLLFPRIYPLYNNIGWLRDIPPCHKNTIKKVIVLICWRSSQLSWSCLFVCYFCMSLLSWNRIIRWKYRLLFYLWFLGFWLFGATLRLRVLNQGKYLSIMAWHKTISNHLGNIVSHAKTSNLKDLTTVQHVENASKTWIITALG